MTKHDRKKIDYEKPELCGLETGIGQCSNGTFTEPQGSCQSGSVAHGEICNPTGGGASCDPAGMSN